MSKTKNGLYGKVVKNNWLSLYTNPANKAASMKIIRDGGKWSNGVMYEASARIFLRNNVAANQEIYVDLVMNLIGSDGKKIEGISRTAFQMDGFKLNTSTNKMDAIISVKATANTTMRQDEIFRYYQIYNYPVNPVDIQTYI